VIGRPVPPQVAFDVDKTVGRDGSGLAVLDVHLFLNLGPAQAPNARGSFEKTRTVRVLAVGQHENLYRDLSRYLGAQPDVLKGSR